MYQFVWKDQDPAAPAHSVKLSIIRAGRITDDSAKLLESSTNLIVMTKVSKKMVLPLCLFGLCL